MFSENLKITLAYILICLLWGSTWLAIRLGLDSLTPIFSAGIRFTFASMLILIIMKYKKIELQKDPLSVKLYLILAYFSFVIPFGLVYWAEQFIPSSLASIIFAVMPFFVILFSVFAFKDQKIMPAQVFGVILGFVGILVIFSEDLFVDLKNDLLGMAAVLVSSVMQAGIAVTMKKYGKNLNPVSMNFVPLLLAGLTMMLFGLLFEEYSKNKFDLNALISVGYLALFGTVLTFTTYYWLMKKINIVLLSISTFITPIIAVILGWAVLGEKFTSQIIAGSSLVLVGILFANFNALKNYFVFAKREK
ncbi:MAG: DMT superfamily drug/metaboltie permease [Ignavibacteria bacterium]|nr:MAG: DMT superfamily drug/metaboltie permease [Ignavibacteria bacterium]KAF0160916.1 MAG: DMT superfamily drug/metaboltie permease [Ignavibacteria bacterium]